MYPSHSTLGERKVPVRNFTAGSGGPKVVRIITRLNVGGPAIQALLLTRELAALEYRTMLVSGSCEPEEGDMRCPLHFADSVWWVPELSRSVRPWRNMEALWRLWRLLRHEKPEIVHTHAAMAGCLGRLAAVLSGVPVIVHTFHGNSLNGYFSKIPSSLFRCIERLLARCTDALCVVSPQQVRELSVKFHVAPPDKFRVLPLGLELDDYFTLRPPATDGPLTVGWFGRMVPVKNIALLAATIEIALLQSPDTRFVIAGDGPDRAVLTDVADRSRGRVEWLGWQREILPAVARCDVLLQTSRNEGTPVALIQGMAGARPFVSTAVGGVVDMVSGTPDRAGGARWYANAVLAESNPGALACALAMLAKNRALLSCMGVAARAFAAQRYRKETLVKNIDALYRELLGKKNVAQAIPGRNS